MTVKKIILLSILSLTVASADNHRKVLGYLDPFRSIEMTSAEEGLIAKIHVEEGNEVKEGDTIMALDTSVLEARLRIAQIQAKSNSAIAVATADYEVAKERYSKLRRLQKSGTSHNSEVTRAAAEVKKTEGRLNMAMEEKSIAGFNVEEIEALIERRILRSPISGVVLEVNRDVAESTAMSSIPGKRGEALARIAQINQLRLVVPLPADLIGKLTKGDKVDVLVLRENSLQANRAGTGTKCTGEIEFLSPEIDPSSETIRTKILIDNSEGTFKPGAHAFALLPEIESEYNSTSEN